MYESVCVCVWSSSSSVVAYIIHRPHETKYPSITTSGRIAALNPQHTPPFFFFTHINSAKRNIFFREKNKKE